MGRASASSTTGVVVPPVRLILPCDSVRYAACRTDRSSTRQAADVRTGFRAIGRMLLVPRLAWWDSGRSAGEEGSPDRLVFSRVSIWQIWLPSIILRSLHCTGVPRDD